MRFCFLILLMSGLVLASCMPPDEAVTVTPRVVETGTAVALSPTTLFYETRTSIPIPTPTPSTTSSSLPLPPTHIPLPTQTPIPTEPSRVFGEIPFQPDAHYKLRSPDSQLLADLFFSKGSPWFPLFINADLQRYYPAGSSAIAEVIQDPMFFYYYRDSEVADSFIEIVQQGVVGYLNEAGIDLTQDNQIEFPGYAVQGQQMDLNGDGTQEWLLSLFSEPFGFNTIIPVAIDENGQYRWLKNEFATYYFNDPWYPLITDYDLTGDGLNEIIQVVEVGNGSYAHWETRIYTWDGTEIVQLDLLNNIAAFYAGTGVEIQDSNQDGIPDIYVPAITHDHGLFCQWSESVIYAWPDGEAQHEFINHEPPDSPGCNLWRTVTYPPIPGTDRIELMTHTLSHPDMVAPSTLYTNFKAMVLVQLGMAYVEVGDFKAATAVLDQLLELPNSSDFVKAIQDIYAQEGERPLQFCRQLIQNSASLQQTDFGRHLTNGAMLGLSRGSGAYDDNVLYQPAICDYDRILTELLQNHPFQAIEVPGEELAKMGIETKFAQMINLDDDAALEWLGIVEFLEPRVVMFNEIDGQWQFDWVEGIFAKTLIDLNLVTTDVTNDGMEDVVAIVTNLRECTDGTAPKTSVVLLYSADNSGEFLPAFDACDSSVIYDANAITPDYFNRVEPIPLWPSLADFSATNRHLSSYMHDLSTAVIAQTDPNIPTKISELLDYLPTDDPEARPYREHLMYLLGYYYELSGDEDTAVSTYSTFIQQAPDSPWAWLAWARLEPIEE